VRQNKGQLVQFSVAPHSCPAFFTKRLTYNAGQECPASLGLFLATIWTQTTWFGDAGDARDALFEVQRKMVLPSQHIQRGWTLRVDPCDSDC